jgi:hypothetical protein
MKYFVYIFIFLLISQISFAQKYHFFGILDINSTISRQYEIIENPANPIIPIQMVPKEDKWNNLLNYGIEFRYKVLQNLPILIGLRFTYGRRNLYNMETSGSSFKEDISILKTSIPIIYQIGLSQKFRFNIILSVGSSRTQVETIAYRYGIRYNPDGTQTRISDKLLDEHFTNNSFYYSPSGELQIKITNKISFIMSIMYESFQLETDTFQGTYKINGVGFGIRAGYSF